MPHILGAMRTAPLVALLCVAACSIERAPSGRPPGPPTAADSLARLEADSAAYQQVTAALRVYYQRFSARTWSAFRESFWPGATITTRWRRPGERGPRVVVTPLDEFIRQAPNGPDRLAVFSESMVHAQVRSYGDLADAWVVYRARFGERRDSVRVFHGVDAFHLMRHDGQWRIVGLTFTAEQPGRPLVPPRDTAATGPLRR